MQQLKEKQFLCSEIYEESWGQFFWSYSTNVGQPINIPSREVGFLKFREQYFI